MFIKDSESLKVFNPENEEEEATIGRFENNYRVVQDSMQLEKGGDMLKVYITAKKLMNKRNMHEITIFI